MHDPVADVMVMREGFVQVRGYDALEGSGQHNEVQDFMDSLRGVPHDERHNERGHVAKIERQVLPPIEGSCKDGVSGIGSDSKRYEYR